MPDVLALTSPPRRGPACRSRAAPRSAPAGPRFARRSPPAGRRTGAAPPGAGSGPPWGRSPAGCPGWPDAPAGRAVATRRAILAFRSASLGIRRSRPPHTVMVGIPAMTGSMSVALIIWPPGSTTVRKDGEEGAPGPPRQDSQSRCSGCATPECAPGGRSTPSRCEVENQPSLPLPLPGPGVCSVCRCTHVASRCHLSARSQPARQVAGEEVTHAGVAAGKIRG